MWKVICYSEMYGCVAKSTVYSGDKAVAKSIVRHYSKIMSIPYCIWYEAEEV